MDIKFYFPFSPYPIQEQFMKELYFTIEENKLGIFESPTGTGKSLSICCSAIQWLKDHNNKTRKNLENEIDIIKKGIAHETSNDDDWLQEQSKKITKLNQLRSLTLKLDNIKKHYENLQSMKARVAKFKSEKIKSIKGLNYLNHTKTISNETQRVDIVDEENKDDEHLLLDDEVKIESESDEELIEDTQKDDITKIYISSRTHSQLSQFVGEIKRTVFNKDTSVVTLASRQHYCINQDVTKLKNANLINERCLDLQKTKSKATSVSNEGKVTKKTKTGSCSSCPYYNQTNINLLKERLLVDIMDMEDLVKNGKELKACPYYASRMALEQAEVVLLSHAGIVSGGARSGTSINLLGNILILDEAHGLTAALEQAHSAPVMERQLISIKTYLQFYINKYMARLSSRNLLSLNQLKFVVNKLLGIIQNRKPEDTLIYTLEDFVIKAEIDHLNLHTLVEFCRHTRLAPKLHGFFMRYPQAEELAKIAEPKKSSFESFLSSMSKKKGEATVDVMPAVDKENKVWTPSETSAGSSLYSLLDFLEMLCNRSENGRVLAAQNGTDTGLKYLLLNPTDHFSDVVKQCRSVIVAGGTMEPINEFRELLLGHDARDDKLTILRCDHVVPSTNVLAVCLSKGPTNMPLNFSYENRQSKDLLDEVCRILRNVCSLVPGGVVCFLPSYSYENTLYTQMESTKLVEHIGKKKRIFREPKSAAEVDQVLSQYASCIRNKSGSSGALLLSVVGGKLSEGLNFSDDLGRCVIVVGLPYPNIKSAELQEKMKYLSRTAGSDAGHAYYETLCMKAVNQCIGRAVRHAHDYACVLLVDERYSRQNVVSALPAFVKKSLKTNCSFGSSIGSIAKFFAQHKASVNKE